MFPAQQTLTQTLPADAYGTWQVQVDYAVRRAGEDVTGRYRSAELPVFHTQETIPIQVGCEVNAIGEIGIAGIQYFLLASSGGLTVDDFHLVITRDGQPYQPLKDVEFRCV